MADSGSIGACRSRSARIGGKDYIATPVIQGPLWQSFIANGQPVEWHFFSDANHGFRHPDSDGFQPHYADLVWPLVTDFLQRRV